MGEELGEGAGLSDWMLVAGQGMLVAFFAVFFYLAIRLCLRLAASGCAYNNPAKSPDAGKSGEAGPVVDPEKPLNNQGKRT